jgi:CubicO group peptidase (beta-lactamase class C family)
MAGPAAAGATEFEGKLASFVRENRLYAGVAAVVHGDELAWSGAYGLADAASGRQASAGDLFRIASITKTVTGTAILQLRDAGTLDLDEPATRWLPELTGSASGDGMRAVTIRRLLSHESGLASQPPGTDFLAESPVYEGAAGRTLARAAEICTAIPPSHQPKYSNLGYELLGEIVQRASGVPYPQYVAERILAPLGMTSTAFEPLGPELAAGCVTGYSPRVFSDELAPAPSMPPLWAEGGLWSAAGDLARWLSFQLSAYAGEPGEAAEPPVLAAATLREMHKPRYLGDEEWSYAIGISWMAVRKEKVTWIHHSGGLPGFTSLACFDRATRVGAIALLNGSGPVDDLAFGLGTMARELVQAAPPGPARLPAPVPDDLRPLLGLYVPPDQSWQTRIEWRDGKLMFVEGDSPAERIVLERGREPGTFSVAPGSALAGEPVVFHRGPGGAVISMELSIGTMLRLGPVTG